MVGKFPTLRGFVIIALILNKDMLVRRDPRCPVNCAGSHARRFFPVLLPEQTGAAGGAKASARCGRRLIPCQRVVTGEVEAVIGDLGCRPVMAAGFAALGAVAGDGIAQGFGQFIGDAAAQA